MFFATDAAAGATNAQKCEADKLKRTGSYAFCRMRADAKSATTGEVANYATCDQKLVERFSVVEAKYGAQCPTTGDAIAIQSRVTANTANLAQALSGGPLRGCVSLEDFGAAADDVTDDATALQAAVNAAKCILVPAGTYRLNSSINVPAGVTIIGEGRQQTVLKFYGVDGFSINGDHVHIEAMEMWLLSSGGSPDPKDKDGIIGNGSPGSRRYFFSGVRLYMRGWRACVNWTYTWGSTLNDFYTVNCMYGLRLQGQSVNNSIVNSQIIANGGVGSAGLFLTKDGTTGGEGLMVSNTLIAQAENCVVAERFLSLNISNCVIDLATSAGIVLTDSQAVMITNSWIYGATFGVVSNDTTTGADIEMGNSISGSRIQAVSNSYAVAIGQHNVGWSVMGNTLKGTRELVSTAANSRGISIVGNHLVSPYAYGIDINGTDTTAANNTGNNAVAP